MPISSFCEEYQVEFVSDAGLFVRMILGFSICNVLLVPDRTVVHDLRFHKRFEKIRFGHKAHKNCGDFRRTTDKIGGKPQHIRCTPL